MKFLRSFQYVIIALMAACFAGAIYTSTMIGQRQKLIQKSARYNIAWLAGQASVEVARLVQTVAGFGVPESGISRDDVQLKLDIVGNRLRLMSSGDFATFIQSDPEREAIVHDLGNVLTHVQGLVERSTDPKLPLQLMSMLEPLDKRLSRLASSANIYGGEKVDGGLFAQLFDAPLQFSELIVLPRDLAREVLLPLAVFVPLLLCRLDSLLQTRHG